MNVKNSFSRYAVAVLAVVSVIVLPVACNGDQAFQNNEGRQIAFNITAPDSWHESMSVDENAPATHCTSVRALSGGDTELYLHTVVADNPVGDKAAVTRGTPVNGPEAFKTRYSRFSLSGICYTGTYPDDESDNPWTTEYAYNLKYKTTGEAESESDRLLWPSGGKVRFFAFAPTVEDFNDLNTGGKLELSSASATGTGSPVLTYTVPTDVTKQVDLMTVRADASGTTTPEVVLNFGHALTAVQIKCGSGMLAGKIKEVTIAGIHGKGRQVIGSETWTPLDEGHEAKYTISKEITLSPSTNESVADKIHVPGNTPIAGTETDNLTFMLLPQTLPEGAKMTIKFVDDATGTERTLTGLLAGQTWGAGKIVTYSVSPSSINIRAKVELDKKDGDIIPYSGVWYDAKYTAKAEVTQEGVDTKTIDIPADKVRFQYRLKDSDPWADCTTDADGLLTIEAQPAYTEMRSNFNKEEENGSKDAPFSLSGEKGEPANCYLVDKAGYYSLDLVYGNGKNLTVPAGGTGLKYFPGYDNGPLPGDGKITGAADAVLLWQDAPDLIDSASVAVKNDQLVFRIRKHTLTQGNAVLAVRKDVGGKKVIIWSWHIWVTPYKNDFYNKACTSTTYLNMANKTEDTKLRDYEFAMYNLGWCDSHGHDDSRKFSLRAVVDMSAYGGEENTVVSIPGEFTQMEYRGSDAGDNTYYQWGRKDPMLGGIYNSNTPKYKYKQRGKDENVREFTMENKQLFNQYNQDGYDYRFCKNVGDKLTELNSSRWENDGNSHGVFIGYTIQHPYMFITNSRMQYVDPASGKTEGGDPPQKDDPALLLNTDFNFRGHWHKPRALEVAPYLEGGTDRIMFNAWDAGALNPGKQYSHWGTTAINTTYKEEYLQTNASDVRKTVFDPCPPGFKVPPVDAFRGAESYSGSGNIRTITFGSGQSTVFPVTGVRNYALRSNEWTTVVPAEGDGASFDREAFYRTTMPAYSDISFVSTATLVLKDQYNRYQLFYFHPTTAKELSTLYTETSSNSYGLPVRPIRDN